MQFINLNFIGRKDRRKGKDHGQTATANVTCKKCGESPSHARSSCPAKDAVCRKFSKKDTLLNYARVKLLQQLRARVKTVTLF